MPIYKLNKTKDGKSQYKVTVCYTDAAGNHKQKSGRCYGAAEAKVLEQQLRQQVTDSSIGSRMTVKQLYDEYIKYKQPNVRTSTLRKSESILSHNVIPYLSGIRLDKLSIPVLQKWKTAIAEMDTRVSTKNNALRELRSMLNYAVRMEYIPKNPIQALGNFRDAYAEAEKDKLHYYTSEQFRKYIAAAESCNKTLSDFGCCVFFYIAYYTGMRKGEINALKWSDIDGDMIHIRRSVCQKLKGGIVETPPKNKSSCRDIQMPAKLISVLKEHRARLEKIRGFSEDFRVCGGISVLSDTNIENHNKKYADLAGLPHIRIHDFRHSHATLLCNEGINIQEVARRLGHSDISMTWNTYSHLYPREEERAIDVLNKVQNS